MKARILEDKLSDQTTATRLAYKQYMYCHKWQKHGFYVHSNYGLGGLYRPRLHRATFDCNNPAFFRTN